MAPCTMAAPERRVTRLRWWRDGVTRGPTVDEAAPPGSDGGQDGANPLRRWTKRRHPGSPGGLGGATRLRRWTEAAPPSSNGGRDDVTQPGRCARRVCCGRTGKRPPQAEADLARAEAARGTTDREPEPAQDTTDREPEPVRGTTDREWGAAQADAIPDGQRERAGGG
ncbi:hypothetical protein GCM10023107_02660 [Actinoplanes octamycinicus]|nr:hypothetical protein Aoc01nite_70310 [Actinoplanes octamycinicus]